MRATVFRPLSPCVSPQGYNRGMSDITQNQNNSKIIGILALQGDYDAHFKMLAQLGTTARFVRTREELDGVDALILPGGESTTIIKLLNRVGLDTAIQTRIRAGMPVYGTCAGMILLARDIQDRPEQPTLDALNITVARNAFGRQIDSFEADVPFEAPFEVEDAENSAETAATDKAGSEGGTRKTRSEVRGVFIRAPYVTEAAPDVQVISRFRDRIVGVRQGSLLATAFHPELTDDTRVHAYFLQMANASKEAR